MVSTCASAERWGVAGANLLQAITTSPSSYLRAGTRFQGAQSSERQKYIVSVEIKRVDLRESFLCGYLRIQGAYLSLLTPHPNLSPPPPTAPPPDTANSTPQTSPKTTPP